MVNDALVDIPRYGIPKDYQITWYEPGFERAWVDIHIEADAHNTFTGDTFFREFGDNAQQLHERQCYLVHVASGKKVGTASAWADEEGIYQGYGRIHWVALTPDVQGKGLAKPLLAAAYNRLRELGHQRAYLLTSTTRIRAINLYRLFGFKPAIHSDEDRQRWEAIQDQLKYPIVIEG
jgi:GNAT superfamily N-acetyltransferase